MESRVRLRNAFLICLRRSIKDVQQIGSTCGEQRTRADNYVQNWKVPDVLTASNERAGQHDGEHVD